MSVVIMYFHSNHRIFTKMVLLHSWSRHLSFYLTYQYMSVLIMPFLYYITTYLYIYLSSFLYASNLFLIIMLTSIIMLHVGPAPLLYPLCIISSPAEEKACVVIFAGLTPPSASPTSAPSMLPTFLVSEWVFDGKAHSTSECITNVSSKCDQCSVLSACSLGGSSIPAGLRPGLWLQRLLGGHCAECLFLQVRRLGHAADPVRNRPSASPTGAATISIQHSQYVPNIAVFKLVVLLQFLRSPL